MSSCLEIWRANEWMGEIKTGRVESISYKATDGTPLTAWLLLPPDHSPGKKLPVITVVYPGSMYSERAAIEFLALPRRLRTSATIRGVRLRSSFAEHA